MLKLGSTGNEVTELQKKLGIMGEFGPKTEDAVKKFQAARGLAVDGIAGPITLKALDNPSPPAREPVFEIAHVMQTRGKFRRSFPEGLVVHFTAGRFEGGITAARRTITGGRDEGLAYWCMAQNGVIVQGHPIDRWGYHAGSSKHPALGASVSQYLLGLEMNCAGLLSKEGIPWYGGAPIPAQDRRKINSKRYPQETVGVYHAYTTAQEFALIEFCLWLKAQRPDVFDFGLVVGHDEVATPTGRKNDPGGSLSVGMPALREFLKEEYARRTSPRLS